MPKTAIETPIGHINVNYMDLHVELVKLSLYPAGHTRAEKDFLLARLLAATAGASPAGPAHKRAPVRIVLDPDATPMAKGKLCGQQRRAVDSIPSWSTCRQFSQSSPSGPALRGPIPGSCAARRASARAARERHVGQRCGEVTDEPSTRAAGWSRLPCVVEKAPSGPQNPIKRAAPTQSRPR